MKFNSDFLFLGLFIFSITLAYALPNGAGITTISTSRPAAGNATDSNISAIAGNITEITISTSGGGTSQSWQGYYGNITGSLALDDGSSNTLYNWSSTSPTGEVFASINDSVVWTNIQCFNFTANGSYADDSAQAGGTSLYGLNASQANAQYGMAGTDADSINATFNSFDHQEFFVGSLQFSANECRSAKALNSTGAGVFEEAILYSPENRNMVFTAIINQNTIGFDGQIHDFQMMVPEDGHGADTNTTAYYFYIEIN